jgi:hypothetical protein
MFGAKQNAARTKKKKDVAGMGSRSPTGLALCHLGIAAIVLAYVRRL